MSNNLFKVTELWSIIYKMQFYVTVIKMVLIQTLTDKSTEQNRKCRQNKIVYDKGGILSQ